MAERRPDEEFLHRFADAVRLAVDDQGGVSEHTQNEANAAWYQMTGKDDCPTVESLLALRRLTE